MPRPPRLDPPGTWHHVMNRGARRQTVFLDDRDRQDFVELLGQLEHLFQVEVHLFCLVGNHYHLLVRSRAGRLSESMKFLSERFTRRSNARHGQDGPIFRGRFHSQTVDSDGHHRWLFRYIHANARDAGWSGPLHTYRWSSLGTLLCDSPSSARYPWLCTRAFVDLFDADRTRMLRFANGDSPQEPRPAGALEPWSVRPQTATSGHATDQELTMAVREVVLESFAAEIDDLEQTRPGSRSDARAAAALIAVDTARLPTALVARDLGVATAAACRVLVQRARARRSTDRAFAAMLADAVRRFNERHPAQAI